MFQWISNFFRSLFGGGVVAKIALSRVLANNPKQRAAIALVAKEALVSIGKTAAPMTVDAFEALIREKSEYFAFTPEEKVLLEEVLAVIRADLVARAVPTINAPPLLEWLARN